MNHMENIQHHIEVTRQQIIGQLENEISHFQIELGKLPADSDSESDISERIIYNRMIIRKRKLISCLS